jgi:hypothetical protein
VGRQPDQPEAAEAALQLATENFKKNGRLRIKPAGKDNKVKGNAATERQRGGWDRL